MKDSKTNSTETSPNTAEVPTPRSIQESTSGKSGALSYSVASNPVYYDEGVCMSSLPEPVRRCPDMRSGRSCMIIICCIM